MLLNSPLCRFRSRLSNFIRATRRDRRSRQYLEYNSVQYLEKRTLLTVISWAAPVTGFWSDASKWDTGTVPGPGDDVRIDVTGANYTTFIDFNATVDSLAINSTNAFVTSQGASLTVTNDLTNEGNLRFRNTTTLTAGTFENNGTFRVEANGNTNATITIANPFTNDGTILLDNIGSTGFGVALLVIPSGTTLTNNGIIDSEPGIGFRGLNGDVVNNETITVDQTLAFSKTGGVLTNNGTIDVPAGQILDIAGFDMVFNQNGGTVNNLGTFRLASDDFNFNGGTLSGNAVQLTASDLTIGPGSTGAGQFRLFQNGNTLSGDVAPAQTVRLEAIGNTAATVTAAADLTNEGTIRIDNVGSTGNATALFVVSSGSTLTNNGTIDSDPGIGFRGLNGDVVNNGTITVDQTLAFSKTNGVLTNNGTVDVAAGQILDIAGVDMTYNHNGGTVDNLGTFRLASDTFNFNGGSLSGNPVRLTASALNIASGSTGAGEFRFFQNGNTLSGDIATDQVVRVEAVNSTSATVTANAGFTNDGLIRLDNTGTTGLGTATLAVTSGVLTNSSTGVIDSDPGIGGRTLNADVVNDGLVTVDETLNLIRTNGVFTNNNSVTVAATNALALNGADLTYNQNAGALTIMGNVTLSGDTFNYNGGNISGTPVRMTNSALNIGSGATGTGSFRFFQTGNTLSGDVAAAQTLVVESSTSTDATLTAASAFTNNGTIRLDNTGTSGVRSATLAVTSGALTNSPTGVIDSDPGVGNRTVFADIVNNGTVTIDKTLSFAGATDEFTNNGSVSIASGQVFNFVDSNQVYRQTGGTLDVSGALTMNGDAFHFSGGAITGGGAVNPINSIVSGVGTAAANFNVTGATVDLGATTNSSGILNIGDTAGGTYTQNSGATLNIELGGNDPGTGYDQINIEDSANFTGTINVSLINGFVPDPCQVFEIATFGSRIGSNPSFAGLDLGGGLKLRPVFTANSLFLVAYDDTAPINIHQTSVSVAEGGATATYCVCLGTATQPTDTVTVNISPDSEVTTDESVLTFDSTNWFLPQEVTVTAVDDAAVEGLHSGTVSHTSNSGDATFNGANIAAVTASITDNDVASVAFRTLTGTATEGAASTSVEVELSIPGGGLLEVPISVTVTDALAGTAGVSDYSLTGSTVTFAAGSADGAIQSATFTANADNLIEGSETAIFELDDLIGPNTAAIGTPTSHAVTIVDEDAATVSFATAGSSVGEADGTHSIGVSLNAAAGVTLERAVSVNVVDLLTGSAVSPGDYTFTTQTVTFVIGAGASSQTVGMTVLNDSQNSPAVTVDLDLQNLIDNTGGQVTLAAPHDHEVTITNDDISTVTINDVTVNEGDGTATFTVSIDNPLDIDLDVDVTYTDVSTENGDFDHAGSAVKFLAGDSADKTVTVAITNDNIVEASESFTASLTSATALGGRTVVLSDVGTGTITDNDSATFTIDNVTASEADGTATFTVSVDNELDIAIDLGVSYADVSTAAADFDHSGDSVSFAARDTVDKIVTVAITNDSIVEAVESFTASLASPTALGGRSVNLSDTGTGTINDNDTATFRIDDVTVNEGDGTASFTVSLDNPLDVDVVVDVTYSDISTSAGDFDHTTDSVTFTAGDTADKVVTVAITDDALVEVPETFRAALSTVTALSGRSVDLTDTGIGTISDNDTPTANEPPIIVTVTSNAHECGLLPGETILVTATFTDADAGDSHTATINWGDGTTSVGIVNQATGTITGSHDYLQGGIFAITVSVTDSAGDSDAGSTTAYVPGVGLGQDGTLYVIGTDGRDHVNISLIRRGQKLRVKSKFDIGHRHGSRHRANIDDFDTNAVQNIVIVLCAGDDHASIGSGCGPDIRIDAFIDGGDGRDHLRGGGGNDVIYGGRGRDHIFGGRGDDLIHGGDGNDHIRGNDGNDILSGGDGCDWISGDAGRDVLIGGRHADDLRGGRGEDILIGASVLLSDAMLEAVRDVWTGGSSYGDRVTTLTQVSGLLEVNVTVVDDNVPDRLNGQQSRDLFFADLVGRDCDRLKGQRRSEDVVELV